MRSSPVHVYKRCFRCRRRFPKHTLSRPLITSSFSCTIFSDMVCCLLSNGVSRLHSTRDLQTMSLFIPFSICATYLTLSYPIVQVSADVTHHLSELLPNAETRCCVLLLVKSLFLPPSIPACKSSTFVLLFRCEFLQK